MQVFPGLRSPVFAAREEQIGDPNGGFVRTATGAILVDALRSPAEGAALLQAARAEAGEVRALIYTHEHGDHHLGSTGYPLLPVIASEGTARGMESFIDRHGPQMAEAGLDPRLPTLWFETAVRLPGDPEVLAVELGGHAEGSTVVWIPAERVLFAGDLVFHGRLAWVGDMRPERWVAALRTLEGWDVGTVIPGHGPVGGKELLTAQRLWLERFLARMEELRSRGTPAGRALEALTEEFELRAGGYGEPLLEYLERALRDRFGFAAE